MFPMMNKQPRRGVNIPDLAGGVNFRDGLTEVLDNQLTDCKNMWFKDGVLKTRPPLFTDSEHINTIGRASYSEYRGTRVFDNIKNTINGEVYTLATLSKYTKYYRDDDVYEQIVIYFYWIGSHKNIPLSTVTVNLPDATFFVTLYGSTLYCFDSSYKIHKLETLDGTGEWVPIAEDDKSIHVPLVATNGKVWLGDFTGDMIEGENLIGAYHKVIYSTVNLEHPNITSSDENGDVVIMSQLYQMVYPNVIQSANIKKFVGRTVTATLTDENGKKHIHKVTIGEDGYGREGSLNTDGYRMEASVNSVFFYWQYDIAIVTENDTFVRNNLEIIFPTRPTVLDDEDKKNLDKIFSMTRAEWFGGAAAGINGGTRLFLGGNSTEKEKNLVVWSDLNNPLYFSENCYFYVGNATSAVTGMAKQSDMLVIFKENETYFTRYNQSESISAESIINQSVIDLTAAKAYFPLTLINPSIGCDLPDTVQLCRNRLVWATRDGKVYTLTSNNQYSERNIYVVGEMVERRLKAEDFSSVGACDWEGHYVLLLGQSAYLMDYNSSGYQYVYSYQKNEDANVKIPWYCWELPFSARKNKFLDPKICVSGDILCAFGYYDAGGALDVSIVSFTLGGGTDGVDKVIPWLGSSTTDVPIADNPISCSFTTKLFNFGASGHRKNIDSVGLFLGANGGIPMNITFITDCGENNEEVVLYSGDTENYTAGHIQSLVLNPAIRSVLRFGIGMQCDGNMSVDGAEIRYRLLGIAR